MSALRDDRAFMGVAAVLFAISIAVTVVWCGSMAAMPGMEMPGGWTMSMWTVVPAAIGPLVVLVSAKTFRSSIRQSSGARLARMPMSILGRNTG